MANSCDLKKKKGQNTYKLWDGNRNSYHNSHTVMFHVLVICCLLLFGCQIYSYLCTALYSWFLHFLKISVYIKNIIFFRQVRETDEDSARVIRTECFRVRHIKNRQDSILTLNLLSCRTFLMATSSPVSHSLAW